MIAVTVVAHFAGDQVIVFPGVGSFGSAMETLNAKGFTEPLSAYIKQDRPFFGICLGLQVRFSVLTGMQVLYSVADRCEVQYSTGQLLNKTSTKNDTLSFTGK